jgi:superfamily II DNA or RNA helicase
MEDVMKRKYKYVVSTYGLMSTGIDVPFFEKLYFCAPISSKTKIKQSIGRLMRQSEGKTGAEVIDFVDLNIGLLLYQWKKRRNVIQNVLKKLT